ncbi:MAG: hypothetical protein ACRDM2_02350 [Gaiellaceae bacterium]
MLRKALLALATATALAAAVPAQANHTLAHKVALLTAKLNCLQKYPVYSFGDYAYAEIDSDLADQGAGQIEVLVPDVLPVNALDFDYGTANPQPSDAFLLGVKRTSACMAKFVTAPNPVSVARAAPAKLARLR